MSIKGTVKRLETAFNKGGHNQMITFQIPYCRDNAKAEQIKADMLKQHGFGNKRDQEALTFVWVIDFAMAI